MNTEPNTRIKFVTKDNVLVMNRLSGNDLFRDPEWLALVLKADAREKGVRIISHTVEKNLVNAIVEWL